MTGPSNRQPVPSRRAASQQASKPWLMVWYRCCSTYGRANRTPDGTRYVGQCPHCGRRVTATIGPNGTDARMFEAW
ncbi:MAG: hypothetical protein HND57_10160 [Planctomycetes bacterium]|nr:hypothetical protein [Planctomycetota bacterium]